VTTLLGLLALVVGGIVTPTAAAAAGSPGTVISWGWNGQGQTDVPADLTDVTALAAGGAHSLALESDGTVVAWGDNDFGQTDVPAGLIDVTAVSAGGTHSLALKGDGTVVAWGDNRHGQIDVPAGLTGVTAIAAGHVCSVALQGDGAVVAWGDNFYGQLDVPAGLTGVTAIDAGETHVLALKSDGTVAAWGAEYGDVGSVDVGQIDVPAGLTGVTAIDAGDYHSLALRGDGTVVAWGDNESWGQTDVPGGLTGVTAISAGNTHSLALKGDGTVVAWGRDDYGQATVPAGLTGVTAVSAGGAFSLALRVDLPTLAITTASVPDGLVGTVYPVTTLQATGGQPPLEWAVSAGRLPAGLVLSPQGVLAGTPTERGDYRFTVTVIDAGMPAEQASRELSLVVAPAVADLEGAGWAAPDPVRHDRLLTYWLVVSNRGPGPASGIELTDVLPPETTFVGFWAPGFTVTSPPVGSSGTVVASLPDLAPDRCKVMMIVVKVHARSTWISGTATVTNDPNSVDPSVANNSVIVAVRVK
jgi:uncharacterized repeat protein (TIGR01451 family)